MEYIGWGIKKVRSKALEELFLWMGLGLIVGGSRWKNPGLSYLINIFFFLASFLVALASTTFFLFLFEGVEAVFGHNNLRSGGPYLAGRVWPLAGVLFVGCNQALGGDQIEVVRGNVCFFCFLFSGSDKFLGCG